MDNFIIKNEDAITALRNIPDGTIDCIITDPPYPTISGGHGARILAVMLIDLLEFYLKMMVKFLIIMILISQFGRQNVIAY